MSLFLEVLPARPVKGVSCTLLVKNLRFSTIASFHNIWLSTKLITSRIVCSFQSVHPTIPADLRKVSISVASSLLTFLAVTCHTLVQILK